MPDSGMAEEPAVEAQLQTGQPTQRASGAAFG
jgi:hypothetical protein